MWTEEYQVALLKAYLELAAARPWIVGTHVWNFADFKTGQAGHRPMGINHKGVFTRDRQPKMAARFLRSQWAADR
jgi:beta-glucuronidase